MDKNFAYEEDLYRAVYPPEIAAMFWRKNGTVSSAAFADPKGLSVERGAFRDDDDVIKSMQDRFDVKIISFIVGAVWTVRAEVVYLPTKHNLYHSEIHGSKTVILLSKEQRYWLSRFSSVVA